MHFSRCILSVNRSQHYLQGIAEGFKDFFLMGFVSSSDHHCVNGGPCPAAIPGAAAGGALAGRGRRRAAAREGPPRGAPEEGVSVTFWRLNAFVQLHSYRFVDPLVIFFENSQFSYFVVVSEFVPLEVGL